MSGGKGLRMAALALLACSLSQPAAAQSADEWPGKQTVKVIVPFAAGSNADLMARLLASQFADTFKGVFVVENRAGTGGILGTRAFAKSPGDGYTLCVCSGGAITVPSVVEKGYELNELVPVSRINTQPLVLVVSEKSEIKSVADLIAYSKKKDGGINYGSSGVGGLIYNTSEVFRTKTGAQMTHIPFKSGPDAIRAIIQGEVDLMFAIMSDVLGPLEAKSIRPIAVTVGTRSNVLPNTPTMTEQGVAGFDISLWNGLFVPRGTPQPVIDKLSALMLKLPSDAGVQSSLAKMGATLTVSKPDQFNKEILAENALWEAGLKDIIRK